MNMHMNRLDLEELRRRCARGDRFEYLYFWGHRPPKTGSVNKSCLSQWYSSSFVVDGVFYPTAEHWMMAEKARLFGDELALVQILDAPDPKSVKALGREVVDFDSRVWEANARRIVREGNVAKFGQNHHLQKFLLATADKVLVEASPYDRVWGIGLDEHDARAMDPLSWQGQNLLGFALMDVREQLRAQLNAAG